MANDTKASAPQAWTKDDELQFAAMKARRDAVVGEREKRLQALANDVWVALINRGPDTLAQADRARCNTATMEALKLFAYDVRAALEPFDNGPPPALVPPPPGPV